MKTKAAIAVIQVAILAAFIFTAYFKGKQAGIGTIKEQTDTLVVHDTIEQIKPVYVRERVVDTMLVAVSSIDTVFLRDSFYIQLPREEKVYSDSLYYAVVSGFRPALDTIRVFAPTTVITKYQRIEAPRFGFGIAAGPSLIVDVTGSVRLGAGVTAGVYYRF